MKIWDFENWKGILMTIVQAILHPYRRGYSGWPPPTPTMGGAASMPVGGERWQGQVEDWRWLSLLPSTCSWATARLHQQRSVRWGSGARGRNPRAGTPSWSRRRLPPPAPWRPLSWQHCIEHMVGGGVHPELKVEIWFDDATSPDLVLPLRLDCRRLTSAFGRS
jgi:hypothetical protein